VPERRLLSRCGSLRKSDVFFEHLLFAVNERVDIVRGEFETMTVRDCVCRARFHTVSTKNAPGIIDVVHRGVALAGRNPVGIGIFCGFNIDAIRRTRGGAKKASYAFLQSVFIAMQHMNSAIARLKVDGLFGIALGSRFPEHGPESYAKPIEHRPEGVENFTNRGCHGHEFIKRCKVEQTAV
jgi:hypothetical protein